MPGCKIGAFRRVLISACLRKRRDARLSARVLAAAVSAVVLAGCAYSWRDDPVTRPANAGISTGYALQTPIPLPSRTLLSPQPEPDCKFTTSDPDPDSLQKLDYERQCYRRAEQIARHRLRLLQGAVDETIKAVKLSERSSGP